MDITGAEGVERLDPDGLDLAHDPELREVVNTWRDLPPAMRAAVLAMVRAAGGR